MIEHHLNINMLIKELRFIWVLLNFLFFFKIIISQILFIFGLNSKLIMILFLDKLKD